MLDYLPDFDPAIEEMARLTRPGGYVLISLPNLASWHNRLALLLGYQPRDVEISQRFLVGAHPTYRQRNDRPVGHIHTATTAAFRELMEAHRFETVRVTAGRPKLWRRSFAVRIVDRLLSQHAGLARRFFYLGRRKPG
jgi:SAM-dependent methyltransferase